MSNAPMPLRMTEKLRKLIDITANHVGMNHSELIRATCKGIRNGRIVIPLEISEEYYTSGNQIMTFKGITFPDIDRDELRRIIALRCFEALKKPKQTAPTFNEKEGVDYYIVDQV